jgi:HK97 gp10 family phage protein
MQFRFIDHSDEIKKALTEAERRALEKVGMFVESEAQENAPVDTGRLRNSITHEIEGRYAVIGSNVEYAPHVELGTSRAKAQPYLRPAIEENRDTIKKIITDELENT